MTVAEQNAIDTVGTHGKKNLSFFSFICKRQPAGKAAPTEIKAVYPTSRPGAATVDPTFDLELSAGDRVRMDSYLEDIREIERRIQRVEAYNLSGELRELPEAPAGVPDAFDEHVKLMFDLQVLAFQSDMTRVFSFKMGRDASSRVYPASGTEKPFHPASHHGGNESAIEEFAVINRYHVSLIPYFLEKLQSTMDGDQSLLDKTMVIYGSPMGDPNVHNHKRCPLFVVGGANGRLEGNMHLRAAPGTPMANVMLTLMHKLGLDDIESFGDSTGDFSLTV